MMRALFEKTGNAVWISHLDLMRVFQRAFKRAGLSLTHTKGFNPRPSVSIALPMSVGVESRCELLDFQLEGEGTSCEEVLQRLNTFLIPGVRVLKVYEDGKKLKHLSYLDCTLELEYDSGIAAGQLDELRRLFCRESLKVEKKSKNGVSQQDIIPMIRQLELEQKDGHTLAIHARICCQNPTLNPNQMVAAIEKYLPDLAPDFSFCRRVEVYNTEEKIFR